MKSLRPVADQIIHRAVNYPARSGGDGLSIQIDLSHVAAYYQYDPRCRPYAEYNSWPALEPNVHLPNPPQNQREYFEWMNNFSLPKDLRFKAERAAGPLAESLEHLSKRVTERNLASGRIDRYKLADVGAAAALGTYSDERVRPYRRSEYRDAYSPTVAIVASIPTLYTNQSGTYCPTIMLLAVAVLWACESAGIQAQAAMVQGRSPDLYRNSPFGRNDVPYEPTLPDGYKEAVQGFMLTSTDSLIPARAYGILLHDDLWMHMKVGVKPTRYDYCSQIAAMDQRKVEQGSVLNNFGTMSGGNAVHWARQMLNADLVIAIGRIDDSVDADVAFDFNVTLDDAIQAIAKQAVLL